ncbi:MAG TPA: PilZ domain-containing protein [Thermodesulfobacteriota bacterium]
MTVTSPPHADTRTVLLVGFRPDEAGRIATVLDEVGHRPLVARSGETASLVLREHAVNLALANLEGGFAEVMGAIEVLREAGCPLLGVGSLESAAAMTDGLRLLGLEGIVATTATPQELVFRVNGALFGHRTQAGRPNRRVPVDLRATFDAPDGPADGRVLNLSETGLFLAATPVLPVNRTVNVRVVLSEAGEPLRATCRVVWTNSADDRRRYFQGMGMQFLQMRPDARAALQRFLKERLAEVDEADSRAGGGGGQGASRESFGKYVR